MFIPAFFVVSILLKVTLCSAEDIRLTQDIVPKSYEIKLVPSLENGNFTGHVSIVIEVSNFYSSIILHGKDLLVPTEQTKLKRLDHGTIEDVPVSNVSVADELITVSLANQISFGEYVLEIYFSGKIRDDMTGFYRSYYYYQGKKRWLGATQFEPHYARRAFPCFDEPRFRANFQLDIVVPNDHDVISNVKPSNEMSNANFNYHFENYPRMPTYLLAWVIFERYTFVSTEPYTINGTEYRLWTQADYLNQTNHAHFVAQRLLNALASYFDVPYSLKKMDQVAIPDFNAGAMENWGIVTYREAGLLHRDKISTSDDYRKTTMVIAHEFTHQWFGDLVTLEWWSYTWLNEAFARYFQYFITLEVYTDWRLDEQFVVLALQPSLEYDSTPQSAMTSDINSLSDINNKFDMVTYSKGASIVRMMDHILTRENFKLGLSKYLKQLSDYKPVANPNDLFKTLSTVAPADLPYNFETVMRSWTDQAGYPVVTVKRGQNSTVILSQKRGLYEADNSTTIWHIPLTYTTRNEANFTNTAIRAWLTEKEKTIKLSASPNDWIIFNIQQKGFYRVNYDESIWKAIIRQLKNDHTVIRSLNRAQLINDAFFFLKADLIDMNMALNITIYLVREIDYAPWQSAITGFTDLLNQFAAVDSVYTMLQNYALKLIQSVATNVGFVVYNGDKMAQKIKRINVLKFAAKLNHQGALSVADQIVKDLATNGSTDYSPDIQQALLCAGLKNTDDSDTWQSIYNLYKNTPYPTQKLLLLFSLTCTTNGDLLKQLVIDTLSSEPTIRRQDSDRLFKEIGSTQVGAKFLLNYLTTGTNYEQFVKYNFGNKKIISDIIKAISGRIYNTGDVQTITSFNEAKKEYLGNTTYSKINSIITKINKRLEKTASKTATLQKWLKEVDLSEMTTTASPVTSTHVSTVTSATTQEISTTAHPSAAGRNMYNIVFITLIILYGLL